MPLASRIRSRSPAPSTVMLRSFGSSPVGPHQLFQRAGETEDDGLPIDVPLFDLAAEFLDQIGGRVRSPESSGALAPAVMSTVSTPSNHSVRSSLRSSRSRPGVPTFSEISVRRTLFELFRLPTTRTRSQSGAIARTAFCRLVVA